MVQCVPNDPGDPDVPVDPVDPGAVPVIQVHGARVVYRREPFAEDRVGVVRAQPEVALGDGDAGFCLDRIHGLFEFDEPLLHSAGECA